MVFPYSVSTKNFQDTACQPPAEVWQKFHFTKKAVWGYNR